MLRIVLLFPQVIARLVRMSGRLCLKHLMTNEELLKLVHLCIRSELPWAPHALACLLQDIVNVNRTQNPDTEMETDAAQTSTSWGTSGNYI